jgi:hypothetical protein
MPCILAILVLAFPRIAIILLYMLTDFFRGVYDTLLIPLLGFIFMPVTLVAYTWLTKSGQLVDAFYLVVIFVAVIVDLGFVGGSHVTRRRGRVTG